MDKNSAGRHASLAGSLECAQHGGVASQFEVGILANNDRAFGTHLESAGFMIALGGHAANLGADLVAAGETDNVNVWMAR